MILRAPSHLPGPTQVGDLGGGQTVFQLLAHQRSYVSYLSAPGSDEFVCRNLLYCACVCAGVLIFMFYVDVPVFVIVRLYLCLPSDVRVGAPVFVTAPVL